MSLHKGLLDLATELVGFNTVSNTKAEMDHSTSEIADCIGRYLTRHGFTVREFPYWVDYQNPPSRTPLANGKKKVNLVAVKGPEKDLRLALSGHMDVVPADEWNATPDAFKLILQDGKHYARGIADMKLFVAAAMIAGGKIDASKLEHPFALYITSDEEIGCVGISNVFDLIDDKTEKLNVPVPKYVVVGEPTDFFPYNVHKGYMFLNVRLLGQNGHSADPDSGRSVVKLALPPIIQCLNRVEQKLRFITDPEGRFNPNFPTLNPGVVYTGKGSQKNKLAGLCDIHVEIRPIPGQNVDEAFRVVDLAVQGVIRDIPGIKATVEPVRRFTPPMVTSPSSFIVQTTQKLSGGKPIKAANFNTEGGIFNSKGSETVIWGPASIDQAHKDDEFADASCFDESVIDKLVELIKQVCGRR